MFRQQLLHPTKLLHQYQTLRFYKGRHPFIPCPSIQSEQVEPPLVPLFKAANISHAAQNNITSDVRHTSSFLVLEWPDANLSSYPLIGKREFIWTIGGGYYQQEDWPPAGMKTLAVQWRYLAVAWVVRAV